MTIWARIATSIILLFALVFSYFIKVEMDETKKRYREATEEPLVDLAHVLAAIVAANSTANSIDFQILPPAISKAREFPVPAQIYELTKSRSDIELTITNDQGIVLFDSADSSRIGADYTQWNDIYLTLQGRYGARSSLDPISAISTIHVAAPIMIDGRIKGVLSVSKSNKNTNLFIYSTQNNIKQLGWALFVIVALVSFLLLYWVTRPITRLTDYVRSVRDQSNLTLPTLPHGEIRDLGRAFEELREALEGRKYIERYVTTLTHELKSPITAIRGALEILQEDVREDPKRLFLTNIEREVERIQGLVEKLLALSSLQNRHDVEVDEVTPLQELYSQIKDSLNLQLAAKDIIFRGDFSQLKTVQGNSFWIREALLNLVQNAVDFSPAGGIVMLRAERSGQTQKLTVEDQGVGVPDWAAEKVFNQFFSLPRPESGKRSSGLGLSIVAEVAKLHRGSARLESAGERGTRAIIEIMAEPRVPTSCS